MHESLRCWLYLFRIKITRNPRPHDVRRVLIAIPLKKTTYRRWVSVLWAGLHTFPVRARYPNPVYMYVRQTKSRCFRKGIKGILPLRRFLISTRKNYRLRSRRTDKGRVSARGNAAQTKPVRKRYFRTSGIEDWEHDLRYRRLSNMI